MTGPLRFALYSGIFVRHDAISNSVGRKLDLLNRPSFLSRPSEATAFVQGTDHAHPRVVAGVGPAEVIRHPAYERADLHIFEFGIAYDLFDLVHLIRDPERIVVVYHNITPLRLVTDAYARDAVRRAQEQRVILLSVGHVVCVSEFSRAELVHFGVPVERTSVLHLPPASRVGSAAGPPVVGPEPAAGGRTAAVELLFVGRMVRSKGVVDLLYALERVLPDAPDVRLTLVGSARFFDGEVMDAVAASTRRWPSQVRFLGEIDERQLGEVLAHSDAFVIPSYHEGYCVPVIEAYAAGLEVVAYDSSNLPNVVGELGQLVPTGDVVGLADALGRVIAARRPAGASGGPVPCGAGRLPRAEWRARVDRHVAGYSLEAYEDGLRRLVEARHPQPAPVPVGPPEPRAAPLATVG